MRSSSGFLCDLIGQDAEINGTGSKKEDRERVLSLVKLGLMIDGIVKEPGDVIGRIVDVIKAASPIGKPVDAGRKNFP
ncbi:MAG TPA: hypothetical protein DDZ40_04290 [Deltaproteobacteria bacterium]|nr:hypothetical protein [Deltaproteobacteria bacterium]